MSVIKRTTNHIEGREKRYLTTLDWTSNYKDSILSSTFQGINHLVDIAKLIISNVHIRTLWGIGESETNEEASSSRITQKRPNGRKELIAVKNSGWML